MGKNLQKEIKMKPVVPSKKTTLDLFKSELRNIINMRHPLVILSEKIKWEELEKHFSQHYSENGRPGLAIRLMVGLHLLKYSEGLSDEEVCKKWEENPYYQYFCGEEYFQHRFPCERSGMTHFRNRVGEEALEKLVQETLAVAMEVGALSVKEVKRMAVDTTVQEKAIKYPTDYGLMLKALEHLNYAAQGSGIKLRQSYARVAKLKGIKAGRYIHARQFRRASKAIKFIRVRLKRVIRDIERKSELLLTKGTGLKETLLKAKRIAMQKKGDKNYLYSWHSPEVECIGKGKARKPYEFGCKVSIATNIRPGKGGHFIFDAKALHGRPYDGHTLRGALERIGQVVGIMPKEVAVDQGYKGHGIKSGSGINVYITGQKRGVTATIKKWLKKRAIVEPIIGHAKNDGLLGRNYLKGTAGDTINATLAAAGFNFRQLLRYLRDIFTQILLCILDHLLTLRLTSPHHKS